MTVSPQAQAVDRRFARSATFKSPLAGVSDAAWDAFVRGMSVRSIASTSTGGGIGSFDLRPRRLGEIGVMVNLRRDDRGAWAGDLDPKYAGLPRDAIQQYEVFVRSTRAYDDDISSGVAAVPPGSTRSGALAVLHCGGRGALASWPRGAFKTTRALFDRVNNLF